MKKLTTISLFIFWAITVAILITGLVFYQNNKINSSALNNAGNPGANLASADGVSPVSGLTLNIIEISKHNSLKDCWLIINNKIYNVTNYLSAHPGGVGTISPYCGKEATQAFATKGGGSPHSGFAAGLLNNYYIGDLNQTASQQQIQQNVNNTNSISPPVGGRGDDDDDD